MRMLLVGLMAILTALFVGAAIANASPLTATDRAYVAALTAEGYVFDDGGLAVVKMGHLIASEVRANPTFETLDTIALAANDAGVSPALAGTTMYYAMSFYAPEQMPLLMAWEKTPTSSSGHTSLR